MKSLVLSKLIPSHIITPFDLHVLSTPPAFILSQDQTLEIYCFDPDHDKPGLSCILLTVRLVRISPILPFSESILFKLNCASSFTSLLGIFSGLHYCLFVKVLCRIKHAIYADFTIFSLSNVSEYIITKYECQQIF